MNLFFSPALHLNANANRRFDPRATDFFPPATVTFAQPRHTGSFGLGVNARIRPTISVLFEYTPRVGFKLGRVDPIFDSTGKVIGFIHESEPEIGFGIQKDVGRHSFSLTFSNTQATTTSRYNSIVLMQFFGYLRRNPNDPHDTDYTGFDFWLTKLNQFNGDYVSAEMVKAFITSTEYRQRFGQ